MKEKLANIASFLHTTGILKYLFSL
uniref:Uncharacterized protein n=1 Tax=Anguilla anguilla TaxID=7936 RepID=A0A0E9W2D0_ANGAN